MPLPRVLPLGLFLAVLALSVTSCRTIPAPTATAPWMPDQGDGTYKNPVLFADYSDPDAVRVGDDYYLTASSFLAAPGLPVLHSRDLVNWTIINHVFAAQAPLDHFAKPRHGQGVWAPAIRYHDGKFWIFYPDPDFGLYVTTATDPAGQWTPPVLFLPGKGLIDPCPLWDDDGQLYLIHGWAKSRSGISNLLTLHKLSPDATRVLDAGEVIIDANKMAGWHTLEGPKLYKRDGWYYVFAPAGGVTTGYQAVFRSRNIRGPYEVRNVLDQGSTAINGPHQGAWVDTASGEDWFLHFQDRGPYGRVTHLQPMRWQDGWPLMGTGVATGAAKGEPVLTHKKPNVPAQPRVAPATSDEFNARQLGGQWQWNANPAPAWSSLTAQPGSLRLACVAAPATRNDGSPAPHSFYDAPNFLLQKFCAPAFTATTVLNFAPAANSETAGLAVFGYNYALLGLRRAGDQTRLVLLVNLGADKPGAEHRAVASADVRPGPVYLRVTVNDQALCHFAWSQDNRAFTPIGESMPASVDRWIGAKFGLIATADAGTAATGHADFDWFRVTAAP